MVITKELAIVGSIGVLVGMGIGGSMQQARLMQLPDATHSAALDDSRGRDAAYELHKEAYDAAQDRRDANATRLEQRERLQEVELKDPVQRPDLRTRECEVYSGARRALCLFRLHSWAK